MSDVTEPNRQEVSGQDGIEERAAVDAADHGSGGSLLPQGGEAAQQRMGARLKQSREYLGLSQQLVAGRTGIPRSAISDIERGARKVDSFELAKLAYIYRKPLEYFIDDNPDAEAATSTVQYLTRAAAGMAESDQEKLVEYARLLEVAARAQRRSPR